VGVGGLFSDGRKDLSHSLQITRLAIIMRAFSKSTTSTSIKTVKALGVTKWVH
jgi:hypothetical protein